MRDIAIVGFILLMIPVVIRRPWIGVMLWVWISLMNPHHFGWGLAAQMRVALIVAAATLIGLFVTRDRVRLPINATTVLLVLLPLWMTVTLVFAFHFDDALRRWEEVMKIFLFILVTASVLQSRRHVETLLWVIVLSVGFFGVKGGLFTVATGGAYRVWGPPGESYISDNNSISVALVMIIPLAYYLAQHTQWRIVRYAMYALIGLSGIAVLGSHSRGAFLAVSVMSLYLWTKSRHKLLLGVLVLALLPVAMLAMPDNWKERMGTIRTYEQDSSAMGRINSWHTAFNIANDRPLVGGGFELYSRETFARYAPDPEAVHSAHSIYFQLLGEHGYVGLLLFLALGITGWMNARRIVRAARDQPELGWASDLARVIQVSLVGYAVGGAFVNIGYWDLPYYEIVILMTVWSLIGTPNAPAAARAVAAEATPGVRNPRSGPAFGPASNYASPAEGARARTGSGARDSVAIDRWRARDNNGRPDGQDRTTRRTDV
ncbi:MAG: putative O-glycosylation ligase, exosortase A system-associated [Burkholderiaceae bacterium]|nr:putative O-glycosylation ligase, exosortase A system-associated [Burkholderiaceae bacterium]